ncbi:transposase InsO family protein [Nonomuraea thailandensis]|uniref:Transposase InsO family protein n=1 Tax=Nonomuraea thailandensis TaxID=1188745 RepID=A0A9X2GFZ0_9ACTN|nr:Mu transposase C-terminal domain-containing protein [Nonomuraea thailandensis]MCP2356779.1 transposase InsO family protein [Nonomuraea thailandensis]
MNEPDETGGRRLTKGTWLWFGDERHQVVGQGGSEVHLLSAAGEWTTIYIAALMAAPGFRLLSESPVDLPSSMADRGALLDGLDEEETASVRDLEAHLNEIRTGYRSGDPERAEPGEPRPAYDQALHPRVSDRVKAKAAELGMGETTVWRKLRRYREERRGGLIDGRGAVVRDPLARADQRVLDAILVQHRVGEREDSNGGLDRFYRRLQDRLDDEHGPGVVTLPSSSTIARYVEQLLPGQYTFGRAPSRRSAAARPQRSYRAEEAVRPGQVVMIDATPLDVIAYDPIGDVTHKVHLVLAIDVATRTLLAWRMTIGDTRAVDVVMLLNDAVTPEPMRPGWKQALAYRMLRLPITREVELEERLELAAARPVIWPEQILVDHAKVNLSEALREACLDLGINLGLARKANPTDKANIERAFGTIREDFAKHVAGYKGSDTSTRGRLVEHAARWSLEDLAEFFAEYVVAIYQRRVHAGLVVPGFPELELSPNQAYGLMVARYGYVLCPPQSHHYCKRLPIEYRTIRPEGIQLDYLLYDDPILDGHRRALSPVPGKGRKWPIRYNPGDPSRVFIFLEGAWRVLFWTHLPDPAVPFTTRMLQEARKLLRDGGLREPSQQEIAEALVDLQRRMDAPESATARTRRELVRAREDVRAIKRDQARLQFGEPEEPPPVLSLVPPAGEEDPALDEVVDLSELEEFEIWDPGAPRGPGSA